MLSPELYITVLAYTSILNPEVPQVCVKSLYVYLVWFLEFHVRKGSSNKLFKLTNMKGKQRITTV